MFYHLKIMLRNLKRGGLYSAINIGGLAIGMAAAILILAWIYHEWSYDRFHTKDKQLYVVYHRATYDGTIRCGNWTPMPLGSALKTDYPEIDGMARMSIGPLLYANNDVSFKIPTGYTDPDFLSMFDFPLLYGNIETAINDPYSVILTEKAAKRLFGQDNPMGKTLMVDKEYSVTVTGVMKDLPGNTLFQFEALVSVDFMKFQGRYSDSWGNNMVQTFVELHPNVHLDLVNESIRNVCNTYSDNNSQTEMFLYPLGRLHLYSKFENGVPVGGLIESLRLFGVIAGLIILIACINFTNLSTARSEKRAKEVGIRKVMGGKRLSLIGLFLGEATLIALIAGIIAVILSLIALPTFNSLMERKITIDLTNGSFWFAGLGVVLLTGLLAGSYSAFYLSSFLPIKVLKGLFKRKQSIISSRKVLIVLQFTIACALIVSTLVINRQIRYAQDREIGYDKDQLIYIRLEGDIEKNYELIKYNLLNSETAASVTKTAFPMTLVQANTWGVYWSGKDPDSRIGFDLFFADSDWTKTVGTTIVEGRDIDIYSFPTDSFAMLLNETAVKTMNLENPIGEIIKTQDSDWHVVGVVKDFIISSPYAPVIPMVIGGSGGWFNYINIKLNGQNRMTDNLAQVEQIFKQYNPAYPVEYQFVDEEYARKFQDEQKMRLLTTGFACLTIFISCMGLFALVAYMAETRRKEIGIRKVLGASVADVMYLLSKEFLVLTLISVTVASPIAWWVMNQWLSTYAYRTNIPWWLFVVVGCISLCIALLTVCFQAFKAAIANPAEAIKSN